MRSALSPYVGAGIGLYTQTHETLNSVGLVTASTTEKKVGWHLGAGAEIRISQHAAFFADYRFRFVKFGEPTDGAASPITIPGATVIPVLQKLKLSHEGSMWTSGLAFYF
jgi:opacity protein-like surface antigen